MNPLTATHRGALVISFFVFTGFIVTGIRSMDKWRRVDDWHYPAALFGVIAFSMFFGMTVVALLLTFAKTKQTS